MAMVLATRRYVPAPYRGRVLLFKQTANHKGRFRFKDYGWGEVVREGLEICEISGDHLALLVEPGVKVLAAKLDAAMKSACDAVAPASNQPSPDGGSPRRSASTYVETGSPPSK